MACLARLARWEVLLARCSSSRWSSIGATVSPVFLTGRNFANLIAAVIEVAIMSLPMALIIIAGEIDLSVESMVGLSASILGYLYAAGVPLELAIVVVLIVGALGGLLNGFLVTRVGLPSLVVTLGTLALYRGLALVVLESRGISNFPSGSRASASAPSRACRSRGRSSSTSPSRSSSVWCCMARGSGARSTPSARTRRPRASPASASPGSSCGCSFCPAPSRRSPA